MEDEEVCVVGDCPSRALVCVVKNESTLEFCGHHFNIYRPTLLLDGFVVYHDEREAGQILESV